MGRCSGITIGDCATVQACVSGLLPGAPKYAQRTTDTAATAGTAVLDAVTAPSFTPIAANRLIRVTGSWRGLNFDTVADLYEVRIYKDGVQIAAYRYNAANLNGHGGTITVYDAAPTVAAHIYKLSLVRTSGTGTAVMTAGATFPAQIVVQDIGVS